jgi:hypothetical protein
VHTTCFTSFLVQNCWRRGGGGGVDQLLKTEKYRPLLKESKCKMLSHLTNTTTCQGILVCIEYKGFCPFVRIGPPPPPPAGECVSPLHLGPGGSHTRLRGRGCIGTNSDEGTDTLKLLRRIFRTSEISGTDAPIQFLSVERVQQFLC